MPASLIAKLTVIGFLVMAGLLRAAGPSQGIDLKEVLRLPPVMERRFGNPRVVWNQGSRDGVRLRRKFVRRMGSKTVGNRAHRRGSGVVTSIQVNTKDGIDWETGRKMLARRLLDEFLKHWKPSHKRFELIPMTPERFQEIGERALLGKKGNRLEESSWWAVRMGEDQMTSRNHVLLLMNNFGGFDRFKIGHASVGLCQLGGDPFFDQVFDPRVPLAMDYHPSINRVFQGKATREIINGMRCYNLWDWLHAQNAERYVRNDVHVIPVSEANVYLLNAYAFSRDKDFESGTYYIPTNNCADLSRDFFDAMRPIDRPLRSSRTVIEFPRVVVGHVVKETPSLQDFSFPSVPEPKGLVETPNLDIETLKRRSLKRVSGRRGSSAYRQWKTQESAVKAALKVRLKGEEYSN